MVHALRFASVLCLCLAMAACTRQRNQWSEPAAPASDGAPAATVNAKDERIVLFAPLDPGPLVAIYPNAGLELPHQMANRVDLLLRGHDGRVGETLPESFAARWDQGRVAATAGAHVVVLTRVVDLKRTKGSPGTPPIPDRIDAVVELRALDVDGRAIYHKRALGRADAQTSPKLAAASSSPESRATWDALDSGLGSLRTFLAAQNDLTSAPTPATALDQVEIVLVTVEFDAAPAGAEIQVDGIFRGHAPLTLRLPERALPVRISLEGHVPWEREVTPVEGMRIQPVLQPEGGAAPAPEAAPADAPTEAAPAETAPAPEAPAVPAPEAPAPAARADEEPAAG